MTRRKEEEKTTDNAKTTFQPMEVPLLCPEATFPSQHQPVFIMEAHQQSLLYKTYLCKGCQLNRFQKSFIPWAGT